MLRKLGLAGVLSLAVLWPLPGALAQPAATPAGANRMADGGAAPAPRLLALHVADQLFAVALAREDALLALAAWRLASGISVTNRPAPDGATPAMGGALPPGPADMMEAARALARGDAELTRLVARAAAQPARGRLEGPGQVRLQIAARGSVVIFGDETVFRGAELAEVRLAGNGEADLDLMIEDENGIEVCRSTGQTDREYCSWRPRWTGRFRIVVVNTGNVPAQCVLATN
jgi:hypothetical protein